MSLFNLKTVQNIIKHSKQYCKSELKQKVEPELADKIINAVVVNEFNMRKNIWIFDYVFGRVLYYRFNEMVDTINKEIRELNKQDMKPIQLRLF